MAAKNEAKVKFSADTKGFNDEIKAANRAMASMRAELQLNEAQMKVNGVSVEGLRAKQKNLTAQMEQAQAKTKALSDKLAVAVEIFGENSDEAAKLRNQLVAAQTAEVKLQGAIDSCTSELERQEEAASRVETASEKLSREIADQKTELDKLKRSYQDAVLEFGEGSDEARQLADRIETLSDELKQNKRRMEDVEGAADKLDRSLEEAEPDPQPWSVMQGAMADLVSEGIQQVIGALSDLFSYFAQLPQETMEFRQDLGTLTTAFDNVGHSTEVATDTWLELYKVFGEDDRAVEAANNIARMADSQEELNDWVDITTGVWATYQDSLPVEGLAEAAAETSKTGTVTGGLADALNWSSEAAVMFADYMGGDVVTAEDAFNEALAECNTEQERQALITGTLTKLYGGAAQTYRETTSAQMEAKEATAENLLVEAKLADVIEPVTTEFTKMKTTLLTGVLPAVEAVSGAMLGAMTWMQEHPVLMKIIAAVLAVVAAAIAALTVVTVAQTVAQWALNSAILANPLTWIIVAIVAAIAAVVAIIILVIEYWDQIVAAVKTACAAVISALQIAWEWISNLFMSVTSWIYENVILPVGNFFVGLWNGIVSGVTAAWNWIASTTSASVTWFYTNVIQPIITFFTPLFNWIMEWVDVITVLVTGSWEIIKAVWGIVAAWFDETVIQPLKRFFDALWIVITVASEAAWGWIVDTWKQVTGWFDKTVIQPVGNFFKNLWSGISNAASNAWNTLKDGASLAWQGIKYIFSGVATYFGQVFSDAWRKVKNIFSTGGKIFSGITEGITAMFKKVVNTIISGINKVVAVPFNAINRVLDKIRSVSVAGISPFSGLGSISVPQIPLLANGGIVDQATLNVAGEAGPEAIIPIDKLQTYIGSAIDRTMQNNNIQALVSAVEDLASRPIVLTVGGREIALATASDTDAVNGSRMVLSRRGLAL